MAVGALATAGFGDARAQTAAAGDFDGDGYADLVVGIPGKDLGARIDAGLIAVVPGDRRGLDLRSSQVLRQGPGDTGRARPGNHFGRTFASGDFDGDGYADLVVGAPNDRVRGAEDAGSVASFHGSRRGLSSGSSSLLVQPANASGGPETGDRYGSAVALGDFDGDGFADLAVGVPGEDVGDTVDAGAVEIHRGSRAGLVAQADTVSLATATAATAGVGDRLGASLVVGDFDGDGFDDLAIGAPGRDVGSAPGAGAVLVVHGSPTGLQQQRAQLWHQGAGIANAPGIDEAFGTALAAGDFDGDGRDDLAIGVPGETVAGRVRAGGVSVIEGSPQGLQTSGNRFLGQRSPLRGRPRPGNAFGAALAAGDFDRDGRDELAVGVPGDTVRRQAQAGSVVVVDNNRRGLRLKGSKRFTQGGRIADRPGGHDRFGSSLLAVDLDGDHRDDLVVGVPGEDIRSIRDAGISHVLFGNRRGLRPRGDMVVSQADGVRGRAKQGDEFGQRRFETWLDRVNLYRSQAGLDPVRERDDLSADALSHSRYLVINGVVAHDQDLSLPGSSQAGHDAGMRSNVYGTTASSVADVTAVDGWVTGPFHAVGFLTPSLREVGYGAWRDPDARLIRMAATLDIYGGERDWSRTVDKAYAWPGNGSVVPVNRHITEWPSPRSHCPGHDGLPVLAFFEQAPSVSSATFTRGDEELEFCVFDGSDYRSDDSAAQQTGRAILSSTNTVVVMGKEPLTPGGRYCFSVRSRGESVQSCFRVDPNA